jgi:hypothetical protein
VQPLEVDNDVGAWLARVQHVMAPQLGRHAGQPVPVPRPVSGCSVRHSRRPTARLDRPR